MDTYGETLIPFTILPKEIWFIILKLLAAHDIVSVLECHPDFQELIDGIETNWLIGGVLPLLYPKFLSTADILNCRQVSKNWINAVDSTFRNHPSLMPPNPNRYNRMAERHHNFEPLSKYAGVNIGVILKSDYWTHMDLTKIKHNPLFGGVLRINVENHKGRGQHSCIELKEAIPFLEKFGKYVYHLIFHIADGEGGDYGYNEVILPMVECLQRVKNLKSLKIMGSLPNVSGQNLSSIPQGEFPFQLESLNFAEIYGRPRTGKLHCELAWLVTRKKALAKLAVFIRSFDYFPIHHTPNLKELHLRSMTKLHDYNSEKFGEHVNEIFSSLERHNISLHKVCLEEDENKENFIGALEDRFARHVNTTSTETSNRILRINDGKRVSFSVLHNVKQA